MLRSNLPRPIRSTLDLSDRKQVKSVRKHLGLTAAELVRVIEKTGNSLAAIQKEVELERANRGSAATSV